MELSHLNTKQFNKVVKYKDELIGLPVTPIDTSISNNREINKYGETEVKKYRQKQKKLSDHEIKEIVERYKKGETIYELGKAYGCHRNTISRNLKKSGVIVSLKKEGKIFQAEDVIRLYAAGYKSKEIAKMYNVNELSIRRCLNNHGVKMRTRWDYPQE